MGNTKNFDLAVIGSGVAGSFAALRAFENHPKKKVILFDLGRPPAKRRRQLEGWFGCFPTGDGKLYTDDLDKINQIAKGEDKKVQKCSNWVHDTINQIHKAKLVKSKQPNVAIQKKFKSAGFDFKTRDYFQWCPDNIHALSKKIADTLEESKNIEMSFDNEVFSILKSDKVFNIETEKGSYKAKKVLICVGRSGWRWVNDFYKKFGLLVSDDELNLGLTIEISGQYLKNFNKSHCEFTRKDLSIGPFYWNGSIIQEDHADLTISAFRSNENRWRTTKVFFPIIFSHKTNQNKGCYETDRLAKLAFLLSGDRVGREKLKYFINKQNQLCMIPEYEDLRLKMEEITELLPILSSRAYYHTPSINTTINKIVVSKNFETEVDNLYVAGESSGITGILSAAISGSFVIDQVFGR